MTMRLKWVWFLSRILSHVSGTFFFMVFWVLQLCDHRPKLDTSWLVYKLLIQAIWYLFICLKKIHITLETILRREADIQTDLSVHMVATSGVQVVVNLILLEEDILNTRYFCRIKAGFCLPQHLLLMLYNFFCSQHKKNLSNLACAWISCCWLISKKR